MRRTLALTSFAVAALVPALPAQAGWLEAQPSSLDHLWLVLAAILVFLMQIGFLFLEAGMVRAKNSINVAMKNLVDFVVTTLSYAAVGFAIMFGASALGGFIGWDAGLALLRDDNLSVATFFLFQVMFCGTASTIVSGAVAERMRFSAYLGLTVLVSALIYPIVGHWAWGSLLTQSGTGWLEGFGFIDFAGSSVVHLTGGAAALATIIVIGPRIGRFAEDGAATRIQGYSPILTMAGVLLLWIGWLGFNAGGTMAGSADFGRALINTLLAGAAGSAAAMLAGRHIDGYFMLDRATNGLIGGLVAITAGCVAATTFGAVATGMLGGLVAIFGQDWLERRFRLDDAVGAVSVHAMAGIAGTLAVALAAAPDRLMHDRLTQLGVQAMGSASIGAFTFLVCFGALRAVAYWRKSWLRVDASEELAGLNSAEHHVTLGTADLHAVLARLANDEASLSARVAVETGDESADLAHEFNRFLEKLEHNQACIDEELRAAQASSELEQRKRARIEIERAAAEEERLRREAREALQRARAMETAISGFDNVVSQAIVSLDAASRALLSTADVLNDNVGNASNAVRGVMSDSGGALENAMAVSTASGQLAEATQNIARQMTRLRDTALDASVRGSEGVEIFASMKEAVQSIGSMIDFIKSLAAETNVLALNAAIEAARSGEAGRGFGVVAEEVKNLSRLTSSATEDMMVKLRDITRAVDAAGDAMHSVSRAVEDTESVAVSVAASISQQSQATNDISRRAGSAADGSRDLNVRMQSLSETARSTQDAAGSVREAAEAMSQIARILGETIDTELNQFSAQIRAAT
ncbi:MAG: ammonium transporter [Blastomonas sp.]